MGEGRVKRHIVVKQLGCKHAKMVLARTGAVCCVYFSKVNPNFSSLALVT